MSKLMKCGHTANATVNGKEMCTICDCFEEADEMPSLEGRRAKCIYCNHTVKSSYDLPFFKYQPIYASDRFYCGCRGWD